MNDSIYKLIVTILVLIIVLGSAVLLYRNLQGSVDLGDAIPSEQTSRTAAPDFTVTDADGNDVKLSDFRGKGVVLNFWASSCGPCKSEMPHFQAAYEEYGEKIHFVMVHIPAAFGDTREDAAKVLEDGGYTFPVYFDEYMECVYQYGISGVPMTVFIDADGNIVSYKTGMISEADLQRRILTITN